MENIGIIFGNTHILSHFTCLSQNNKEKSNHKILNVYVLESRYWRVSIEEKFEKWDFPGIMSAREELLETLIDTIILFWKI